MRASFHKQAHRYPNIMLSPSYLSNVTSWPSYQDIWRQVKESGTPATAENQATETRLKTALSTSNSLSTQN